MLRLAITGFALALVLPAVNHAALDEDIQAVAAQLVCYCGCSGLTVAACSCGTADDIRQQIAAQLDSGLEPDEVVEAWVAERGEQILAVPTRRGFNLVGWLMPFLVTLAGLVFLSVALLRRTRTAAPASPVSIPPDDEQRFVDRIEEAMRTLRK